MSAPKTPEQKAAEAAAKAQEDQAKADQLKKDQEAKAAEEARIAVGAKQDWLGPPSRVAPSAQSSEPAR